MFYLLVTTIGFVNSNTQYLNISETQLQFDSLFQADIAYKKLLEDTSLAVPNFSSIKLTRIVTKLY